MYSSRRNVIWSYVWSIMTNNKELVIRCLWHFYTKKCRKKLCHPFLISWLGNNRKEVFTSPYLLVNLQALLRYSTTLIWLFFQIGVSRLSSLWPSMNLTSDSQRSGFDSLARRSLSGAMQFNCGHASIQFSTGWKRTLALLNTGHSASAWHGASSHLGPQTGHPQREHNVEPSTGA